MSEHAIGDKINTRALVSKALIEMGQYNPSIWALTSDCGGNLGDFIQAFPDRFVDTGIAEQNAAGIAAGLALSGAIPYIVGMTPFVTMRAFEQNRTAISYQNLPVRIIGWVGGMATGGGSTHYAIEDIAIMRAIANMNVISIADPLMMYDVMRASEHIEGPMFIRLTMAKADPVIYEPGSVKFQLGKGAILRQGNTATIFAHGGMVSRAMKVADDLAAQGIDVCVVDMYSIKPLDEELVLERANASGNIIVWEDHFKRGGLASAIADLLMDKCVSVKRFERIGVPETYPGFGPLDGLYEKYGMDPETVKALIRTMK